VKSTHSAQKTEDRRQKAEGRTFRIASMAQALGSAIFCLLPSVFSLVPFNENADRFEMRELRRGDTEARGPFVVVV